MTPNSAGTDAALMQAAREAAFERVLRDVKTEVLGQAAHAGYWGVNKNKIRRILEGIDGAEKVAGGWRVPVHRMPLPYHVAAGLIRPANRDAA